MFIRFCTWLLLREYCEFILISNVEKEAKNVREKLWLHAGDAIILGNWCNWSLSLFISWYTLSSLLPIRYRQFKYIKTLDSHSALISLFSLCFYSSVFVGDFNFFFSFLFRFVLWWWNFLEIGLNVHIAYIYATST